MPFNDTLTHTPMKCHPLQTRRSTDNTSDTVLVGRPTQKLFWQVNNEVRLVKMFSQKIICWIFLPYKRAKHHPNLCHRRQIKHLWPWHYYSRYKPHDTYKQTLRITKLETNNHCVMLPTDSLDVTDATKVYIGDCWAAKRCQVSRVRRKLKRLSKSFGCSRFFRHQTTISERSEPTVSSRLKMIWQMTSI